MPTHDETEAFSESTGGLALNSRRNFAAVCCSSVMAWGSGHFHPSLRIKRYKREPGVWEMSWAPDGRATFKYGEELTPGSPHIVWLRIGSHEIFRNP